jgi:regulator of cell morphogenesis and NO signaling
MLTGISEMTVGDLVNENLAIAAVLDRCGIDFWCEGRMSLEQACRAAGANVAYVCREIERLEGQSADDDTEWPHCSLTALTHEIKDRHHGFLRGELPRLEELFRKVESVHGKRHSELRRVHRIFRALVDELWPHLQKEERLLFPMVRALEAAYQQRRAVPLFHCGSISNPIEGMMEEHRQVGAALRAIRRLTDGYRAPPDACASYRTLLDGLVRLEHDLHLHMHKENNLLFPRAVRLEAELSGL